MDIANPPERVAPEEMERLRELGRRVGEVIASGGLPVTFEPARGTLHQPRIRV